MEYPKRVFLLLELWYFNLWRHIAAS